MSKFKNNLSLSAVLCLGAATVPMGFAHTASAQTVIDEIVVTAQRREQNIQDVPIAVTAISGDMLEKTGAIDITSIQRMTPNTTIEVARGSSSTLIAFIRGVGQQDPLWGFEPGVGIYVDDVYLARPQGAVMDIFDVERVEVLRGPQGTLYGRNTIGGAVKYITKNLNMESSELSARINVGSYGQFDQIIRGSLPLSETFAIGGAIANYKRNGFGENLNTGAEHYDKDILAMRFSAEWAPTDRFNLRLAADKTQDDSNAKHGHRLLPSADGSIPVTKNVYDTRAGIGDENSVETQGVSLTAEYKLNENITLKSITAFREGDTTTLIDFDALPNPDFDVPARYDDEQFSQELQVLFSADKFSGVAGLYYLDGTAAGEFDVILEAVFGGLTVYQSGTQQKKNLSAFADITYDFSDKFSLSVGARYAEDKTVADVTRELWLGLGSGSFDASNTSVFFTTQTGYEGLERKDNSFTPRVALSYKPNDDLSLYASYSQGVKAGGFDPRARADLDPTGLSQDGFGPETVDSYEAGIKGSSADGTFRYSIAAFLADYTDQQITVQQGADSDNDGVNDTFISSVFNAGHSQYKGLEFEAQWYVNDNFSLSGVLGYIDADIKEILSNGVDISENFVTQNTPELTARLGFNYNRDLASGNINVNGAVSYRDKYNLFNVELPGFAAGASAVFPNGGPALDPEAYALVDLGVVWTSDSDSWSFGVHGRNLTDKEYRVAAYNFVTPSQLGADAAYSAFYGAPRTFTATLGFKFK
ncbi:MAG: TonB-dependent receptor [Robiginitomaculum sp.]|nr:MAG: TonB-dependent receptor [Robiginitomaculum sp.]